MEIQNVVSNNRRCEMHACLRKVMRLSRWAGLFPVEGLDKASMDGLKFQIKSIYGIYCISSLVGQIIVTGFSLYVVLTEQIISLVHVTTCLFYITALISSIFLLRLAQNWPSLISKAMDIEYRLTVIQIKQSVSVKSYVMGYVIMFLGLVEHLLSLVFNLKIVLNCVEDSTKIYNVFENFFILRMSYVFEYTSFNMWKAVTLEIVNLQATFVWSFVDVMISCISIYISEYFKELNKLINSQKDKTANTWELMRLKYSHLVALVKEVDNHMSHCVLLCFFTDLFFICIQLFNTLNKNNASSPGICDEQRLHDALHGPEHTLYFFYSFIFLAARVLILSLSTANVNSVAQGPIFALSNVPASIYNITIQRFSRQINYTTIAISGLFFKVTRTMILKVVGTIITYELVLLQFNPSEKHLARSHSYVYDAINNTIT